MDALQPIEIERVGGFAGFGGPGSHLRSRGALPWAHLSATDREQLERLLAARGVPAPAPRGADGFRYRITTLHQGRPVTVEVHEDQVPAALRDCVQDELI